jgi:hypothetical protein
VSVLPAATPTSARISEEPVIAKVYKDGVNFQGTPEQLQEEMYRSKMKEAGYQYKEQNGGLTPEEKSDYSALQDYNKSLADKSGALAKAATGYNSPAVAAAVVDPDVSQAAQRLGRGDLNSSDLSRVTFERDSDGNIVKGLIDGKPVVQRGGNSPYSNNNYADITVSRFLLDGSNKPEVAANNGLVSPAMKPIDALKKAVAPLTDRDDTSEINIPVSMPNTLQKASEDNRQPGSLGQVVLSNPAKSTIELPVDNVGPSKASLAAKGTFDADQAFKAANNQSAGIASNDKPSGFSKTREDLIAGALNEQSSGVNLAQASAKLNVLEDQVKSGIENPVEVSRQNGDIIVKTVFPDGRVVSKNFKQDEDAANGYAQAFNKYAYVNSGEYAANKKADEIRKTAPVVRTVQDMIPNDNGSVSIDYNKIEAFAAQNGISPNSVKVASQGNSGKYGPDGWVLSGETTGTPGRDINSSIAATRPQSPAQIARVAPVEAFKPQISEQVGKTTLPPSAEAKKAGISRTFVFDDPAQIKAGSSDDARQGPVISIPQHGGGTVTYSLPDGVVNRPASALIEPSAPVKKAEMTTIELFTSGNQYIQVPADVLQKAINDPAYNNPVSPSPLMMWTDSNNISHQVYAFKGNDGQAIFSPNTDSRADYRMANPKNGQ